MTRRLQKLFYLIAIACLLSLATQGSALADQPITGPEPAFQKAPAQGGARRWQVVGEGEVQLRKRADPGAAVAIVLPSGTVLNNMGCSGAQGSGVWCDVRPFRGGPRGFVPVERLIPAEGPDGTVPMGRDDSRQRASKRQFDAQARVPCAQEQSQSLGTCDAAVARGTGGDATVVVKFANGFRRQLYFVHGEFVSASATMSGVGRDVDWQLAGGVHRIRVDDQRFELPDALVYGE